MERNSAAEYDLVSCQLQSRFVECPFVERECLRKRLHRFYSGLDVGLIPAPLHSQLQNSIRIKWSGPSILILLYPTSTAFSSVITNFRSGGINYRGIS